VSVDQLAFITSGIADLKTLTYQSVSGNRRMPVPYPYFSGNKADWPTFTAQWNQWLGVADPHNIMPPLEKIATFASALDKVSRFYVDYHREISLARGDQFDFETAWRVVSDRFPPDPTLAKAMWKSVTLHNKKGSSVPSVEEWNRFEAEWRLALLRVPEILSSSEQYVHRTPQTPRPLMV
jgi:hypothetical protein